MSIIQLIGGGRVFDFGTLNSAGSGGGDFGFFFGNYGGLTNRVIGPGLSIDALDDRNVGVSGRLVISGFGADPGQGYIKAVVINALATRFAGAATSYGYAAGTATWGWAGAQFGFALATPYTGLIII